MSCCHQPGLQQVRPGTARVRVTDLSGPGVINPTPAKGPDGREAEVELFEVSPAKLVSFLDWHFKLACPSFIYLINIVLVIRAYKLHGFAVVCFSIIFIVCLFWAPPTIVPFARCINVMFPSEWGNWHASLSISRRDCCVEHQISRAWHHWTSALTLVKTLWETLVGI